MSYEQYIDDALALLKELIATPSVSRDETAAADVLARHMEGYGIKYTREGNNIWALSPDFAPERETILLNAHIDTVKPVGSWTRAPFTPTLEGDRLYGLGANDCGGGLVSLLQAFRILTGSETQKLKNFIFLASCEEEVSGQNGIVRALPLLPHIDVAIVGEPTGMQPAVAEKGLMVIDMTAHGRSGHAARAEGVNAIYEMLDDVKNLMTGLLDPIIKEHVNGHASIRQIFDMGKRGKVAGCMCMKGKVTLKGRVRVKRKDEILYEGKIQSLRRFQNEATEVREGQECGIVLDHFTNFIEGDTIESYEVEKVAQSL